MRTYLLNQIPPMHLDSPLTPDDVRKHLLDFELPLNQRIVRVAKILCGIVNSTSSFDPELWFSRLTSLVGEIEKETVSQRKLLPIMVKIRCYVRELLMEKNDPNRKAILWIYLHLLEKEETVLTSTYKDFIHLRNTFENEMINKIDSCLLLDFAQIAEGWTSVKNSFTKEEIAEVLDSFVPPR